ncbi:MAG: hypothetical protein AAF623_20365 [Planctomycetota bacterium]
MLNRPTPISKIEITQTIGYRLVKSIHGTSFFLVFSILTFTGCTQSQSDQNRAIPPQKAEFLDKADGTTGIETRFKSIAERLVGDLQTTELNQDFEAQKSLIVSATKELKELVQAVPESKWADDAQYLSAY